jgi:hypothetical protein
MKTASAIRRLALALFLFGVAPSPAAADEYIKPALESMLKTLFRFGAIDISDDAVIDEYAMMFECKLYTGFYNNEFKWRKVRPALRESIRQDVAGWPTSYYYDAKFQLSRYDFGQKMYRIMGDPTRHHVNVFMVYDDDAKTGCNGTRIRIMPTSFRIVLEDSVYFPGIPLAESDAKALLQHMTEAGNTQRFIYVRFNMRVNQVSKLFRSKDSDQQATGPLRQDTKDAAIHLNGRLDSVNFYEDEARTKLIYSYRP